MTVYILVNVSDRTGARLRGMATANDDDIGNVGGDCLELYFDQIDGPYDDASTPFDEGSGDQQPEPLIGIADFLPPVLSGIQTEES